MFQKYSAIAAAADQSAIEEIQMFLPVFLVSAETSRRQERRRAAEDITARMIYNDLKEALALIIHRTVSPQSVLKNAAHKLSYVHLAAEDVLKQTQDDFDNPRVIRMINALTEIKMIARVQTRHFKGYEAEALPTITRIAQDALKAVYRERKNMKHTKCSSCGVDLPGAPSPAKCSQCVQKERAEMDRCGECGRLFLARASFDNFYCDDCYKSPEYPFNNEHYGLEDVSDDS